MRKVYERFAVTVCRAVTLSREDLKREEGQGATEYGLVILFLIIGLSLTIGVLGTKIGNFLSAVGDQLAGLLSS